MDQTQPRGDFVAFLNRDKQPGDRRPSFEGCVAKPGTDEKREWRFERIPTRTARPAR